MNQKMERIKKSIDGLKNERNELREKYNYLVEQMKKTLDKNSRDIESLKSGVKGVTGKEDRSEMKVVNIRDEISSLKKSIAKTDNKYALLKDKLAEDSRITGKKLDAEITSRMKDIRSELVGDLKNEIDKSFQGLRTLEKEANKIVNRHEKSEDEISNIHSMINSLDKLIGKIDGKQAVLKEKVSEDMKSLTNQINLEVGERMKAIETSLRSLIKDMLRKNIDDIRSMKDSLKKMMESNESYEKDFSKTSERINSIEKSLSEMEGKHSLFKNELNDRIAFLEKEMGSELSKVKGVEERLAKDVEDFEKFANNQKIRQEKLESKISGKIDLFSVGNENLKKEFISLSNDFKNIGQRLDSLRDKDAEINQRTQGIELDIENSKKAADETFSRLTDGQNVFKENMVAKLNETSEKIISRLSQDEIKTSSEIAKQSEEIKLFRAHVTNFINDLVSNYDKRFEMMKAELDQTLKIIEERSKEQRALIFE